MALIFAYRGGFTAAVVGIYAYSSFDLRSLHSVVWYGIRTGVESRPSVVINGGGCHLNVAYTTTSESTT